ncbi:MAG: DUF512 domain-containing protein [bacterium]
MPAIINCVLKNSIAEDLELCCGDEIINIDGLVPEDLLDFKYFTSNEEFEIHIKRKNGEEEIIELEKDIEEDLGIVFESAVFDKVIPCSNKCVFCFVDQQPKGLRPSLYVKDDDYRLSCLQGSYVTLTNLSAKHKTRIETLRPGPFYVSVHTTNPELRVKMLKNPKASNILKHLKWLNELNIPVHTQVVLCPGLNDGNELINTLNDLSKLQNILSIAVVPVGITKFREEGELNRVIKSKAEEVLSIIDQFNKKVGHNIAFASDEFYILANEAIPSARYYNGFGQLDDGVGSCRVLLDDFNKYKSKLPKEISQPKKLTIATGKTAAYALNPVINELNKINNLNVELKTVNSTFWGDDVTVAGLLTGNDLINALIPNKGNLENLIIPSVMIRKLTNQFLDDITVEEVESSLGTKLIIIDDYYSTKEFINLIK